MPGTLSRRDFLRRTLVLGVASAAAGGFEAARKAWDLYEQHRTWDEASRPNAAFFERHAADLARSTLGGSFAPEQWPPNAGGDQRALQALALAVRELGIRRLRLGLRWNRVASRQRIDLAPYRPFLDYCVANGVELCLNVGPVRVFRWPEEHLPADLALTLPPVAGTIELATPFADAALDHLDGLLAALVAEYGPALSAVRSVQIENEPFFPLGPHRWRMARDYLAAAAHALHSALPGASLLVTSAGRLDLAAVRGLFRRLLAEQPAFAGRLVSGFDFHYKTPLRDSFPVVRHFDQVAYATPLAPGLTRHVWDSRDLGFGIEVSEAQAEPYGRFDSPGNSARDFRFLLLRCLGEVLDPLQPALIRVWGVERLTELMLRGELTSEHRDIIEILQHVNQVRPAAVQNA